MPNADVRSKPPDSFEPRASIVTFRLAGPRNRLRLGFSTHRNVSGARLKSQEIDCMSSQPPGQHEPTMTQTRSLVNTVRIYGVSAFLSFLRSPRPKLHFVPTSPSDHSELHFVHKPAIAALHPIALHHRADPLTAVDLLVSHRIIGFRRSIASI